MIRFVFMVFLIINFISVPGLSFPTVDASARSHWITGAKMPTARSEAASVLLDGKIYVIGGEDNNGEPLNNSEAYDFKLDKWTIAAPLPVPLDHSGADEYNGKIYLVGGQGFNNTVSNKLFIYDPLSNKWEEGKPMPTARLALTADFVNGTLYAIGGKNTPLMGFAHENLNINEAYDPKNNTWTAKAPMPTQRHHLTSEVVDGKLYVIGGRNTGRQQVPLDNNEMYDPIKDTWAVKAPMPSKRGALGSATSADGNIYVFGGESCDSLHNSSNMVFNNNEKYDPKTDKWTLEAPMPTARHGMSVQFVNGSMYLIGGGPEPCASMTNVNEIFLNVH